MEHKDWIAIISNNDIKEVYAALLAYENGISEKTAKKVLEYMERKGYHFINPLLTHEIGGIYDEQ